MITVADFRARFPEFAPGPDDATVQAALDAAYLRTPSDVWGVKQDDGAAYLAAHLLALAPQARDMRIGKDARITLYMDERDRMARTVASGFRVTGSDD